MFGPSRFLEWGSRHRCNLQDIKSPEVKFKNFELFSTNLLTPFNSQNTFISGKILKYYPMLPFIGRMDDIWASFYLTSK